jgi:S1-C subfamily serine protease
LGERPVAATAAREWEGPPKPASKTSDPRGNALHLGITLAELTPQLVADKHLNNVQGLYVKEIDPNGLVAELRLPPSGAAALIEGDVVNRINRTPVTTLADFTRVLNSLKPGDPVVLNVTRTDTRGNRQVPLIVQFTYQ